MLMPLPCLPDGMHVLERGWLVEHGVGGIELGGKLLGWYLGEGFAVGHFPQCAAGGGTERHLLDKSAARFVD